jgi:hypothetical protein
MASTIKNLLIGIGFDYDKKSQKQVESSIDGLKSKALQLGAVVGGAFGIKALTVDFANAKDELGRFSEVFGVTASDVHAFGLAIQREGGTLDSFMGQLQGIEKMRAGLLKGDAGFIAEVGRAKIDANVLINAKDANEALILLADQFKNLSQQERINAAQALGLDETMLRLLSRGSDEVRVLINNQKELRDVDDQMTEASRQFNAQLHDLQANIGGFSDQVGARLLPHVTEAIVQTNNWIGANRGLLDSGLNEFLSAVEENFIAIGAALGLLAASKAFMMLRMLSKLPIIGGLLGGSAALGGALTALAGAGVAGYAVGSVVNDTVVEGNRTLEDFFGRGTAMILAGLGNEQAQEALRAESQTFNIRLNLDGQVLDERTLRVLGDEVDKTLSDTESTQGG